ncbi:LpqB family beta-propeller domain-containing protein [Diaminobutyricibacter sp. McL0608]|uniref:LpqB family beta-propeller domain-containing protein n=1 Tax=Leifsonia sp. McL0608 TaxID=3143537 RepID=UPI0031F32406
MSRRFAARVRILAVVAAFAAALAGCASIPDDGPVRQGAPIAQRNDPLDLDFNPSPPATGATQDQIVHGFIDAASSPKNDFQIAREYLTASMSSSWNPNESVTVDQGTGRLYNQLANGSSSARWQVDVTPVANVDSVGAYHGVSSSTPISLRYDLVKVNGEWRISVAPNGVVIDDPTFRAVYAPQTLYFYNASFTYLVPDLRWFPSRVGNAATRVTNAVLAGPAKWLVGAVTSAFPPGTQLALPSVTISNGRADVDLSSQAGQADALTLQRMKYQLEQSLGSIVSSVQLSIEGTTQSVAGLSAANAPIQDPQVDNHALAYRNGQFGLLSATTVEDIPGISTKVASLHPTSASLTANHDTAVVLSQGHVYVVRKADAAPLRVDARAGLIAPAVDNYGYAWSVPADKPGALVGIGSDAVQKAIKTNWPNATRIVSLQVSRDGTRVIAVLLSGSTYSLVASGIVRGQDNLPTSLTEPIELGFGPGKPLSATWIDQLNVAVLSNTGQDGTAIALQQIGGTLSSTTGPASGATIVGAAGLSSYLVLTSDGSLQAPTGTGWQAQADKVGALGTQLGQPQ